MSVAEILEGYATDNFKVIQGLAAVANGTSSQSSSAIDMSGYAHALIIATVGTPAANNTLTLENGATSTTAATVATTNDATKTPLVLDVQNVPLQYIKATIARGTSTTIDQVIVILYGARAKAVTQPTTVKVATFNAPALA
jgi:hypothetical protein